jgi:hypothetical protein
MDKYEWVYGRHRFVEQNPKGCSPALVGAGKRLDEQREENCDVLVYAADPLSAPAVTRRTEGWKIKSAKGDSSG